MTFALGGAKAFRQELDLIYRCGASHPSEICQASNTPIDVSLVQDDGKPTRPWLTIIVDDHSRTVAGYFLSFHVPSDRQPSLVLRQAIWRKDDLR